jgi:hypothetical protein
MKKYITYAMTAFFATIAVSIAAPDKDAMMAKEKAAWQAFKDKKSAEFKKLLSADFMGVYSDGVQTLQKELDTMQKWDMKSFAISDYNIVSAGADTVISSYKVIVAGSASGKTTLTSLKENDFMAHFCIVSSSFCRVWIPSA